MDLERKEYLLGFTKYGLLDKIDELEDQLAEALGVLRPLIGALHCGTHKLSQGEFIRVLQAGAALLADTTVSTGEMATGELDLAHSEIAELKAKLVEAEELLSLAPRQTPYPTKFDWYSRRDALLARSE